MRFPDRQGNMAYVMIAQSNIIATALPTNAQRRSLMTVNVVKTVHHLLAESLMTPNILERHLHEGLATIICLVEITECDHMIARSVSYCIKHLPLPYSCARISKVRVRH